MSVIVDFWISVLSCLILKFVLFSALNRIFDAWEYFTKEDLVECVHRIFFKKHIPFCFWPIDISIELTGYEDVSIDSSSF